MTENDIRKYARLMKELELSGIEIDETKGVFRLERENTVAAAPVRQPVAAASAPVPHHNITETPAEISFTSPMVGMFYAAPAENAEPFAKAGDVIRKGDTLCIIESMKLMNEVTAEKDCVITEVCAQNGQVVEYGTELFRIKEMQA